MELIEYINSYQKILSIIIRNGYPSGQVHLAPLKPSFDLCKKERYEKTANGMYAPHLPQPLKRKKR